MKVADRIASLPAYPFAQLGRRIRQLTAEGNDVIRLDIGSPDLPPPEFIVEAMIQSSRDPSHHGYSDFDGTPQLRRSMAAYYERRFGVQLDPDKQIVPLIGSKEGIANVALAFVDVGSVVLVPDPGYAPYGLGTLLAGGTPVTFALTPENDYLPDLEAIAEDQARAARILWLNYPNNPTGAVATLEFFERAVAFAKRYDLLICHDNPYCDLVYDGYQAPSLLQVPGAVDVAIEFNSLSKTYNMAGWRVGMAVGNAFAVEALGRTKTNIDSGLFRPIQDAAALALTADQSWLQARNAVYAERRDLILATLRKVGLRANRPLASLYLWIQIPDGYTAEQFATRLLEEASVSVTPGTVFGAHGEGFFRISLGCATDRVREAMERLERFSF